MSIPFVKVCALCQKEFPEINNAIVKAEKEKVINFSHGYCRRHFEFMLSQILNMHDEKKKASMAKLSKSDPPPDLKEHPNIVSMYSKGIFTPEQYELSQFNLKE